MRLGRPNRISPRWYARQPRVAPLTLTVAVLFMSCHQRLPQPMVTGYVRVAPDARLFYGIVGAGPDTIIVLHGGPGLQSQYLHDAFDALAPGRTIIYYDQRGRGRSDSVSDSTALTAAQDVADLDSLRRFFKLSRVSLAAHHWGAVLGALYAKRFPEHVRRLVLVSPSFPHASYLYWASTLGTDSAATAAYLEALREGRDSIDPRRFCEQYWGFLFAPRAVTTPALVHRLARDMCGGPLQSVRRGWAINRTVASSLHGLNLRDTLGSVSVPTLIVQGAADTATAEAARAWTHWTPGAREVVLPPPALFPWLGSPARFVEIVTRFLDEVSPTSPPLPHTIAGSGTQ